jgi:hypothetical protein
VHLRADAFELSPNAVYAAVGRPGRLVIIDPATMRFVKAHRVRGTVVAIAWAPIGIRIAYIVRHDGRYALHLIEGDLSGDTVVDRSVRAITPTWRWDSLAFAYVARGDRVTVRDLEFTRTIRVRRPHCLRKLRTDQLAFAPHGTRLAVGTAAGSEAWIGDTEGGQSFCLPRGGPTVLGYNPGGGGFAWISGSELVTTPGVTLVRIRVGKTNGRIVHEVETPAGLTAIAAAPDRRSLALEFSGHNLNVMVAAIPRAGAKRVAFMLVLLHEPNPGLRRGQGAVLWR